MTPLYPWQTKQWHTIFTRWQNQKLPHALLFVGPKGLGKSNFAQTVANRLLCQTTTTPFACGTCQSCEWLKEHTHPDLFIVQPEADSNVIKIEQIRELLTQLQQTAQQTTQVVILEPAEAMNKAASNALLKMLEEPSGSVVFLLVSHQPGAVLATVRSRCQMMNFPIPTVSVSLEWLQSQLPTEQNAASLLALCENIPLRAQAFAEATKLEERNRLIQQFIQLSQNNITPLQIAAFCADMAAEQVYEGICLLLLDLARLQQSSHNTIAHIQHRETLTQIANQISAHKIFHCLDQLLEIKKHLNAKIHLNMLLLWETLFIEWVI